MSGEAAIGNTTEETMKNLIVIFLASIIACGCGGSGTHGKPGDKWLSPPVESYLPPGAKNIKEIGNGWAVFDLNIDHKKHRFLFVVFKNNHGNVASITEINEEPK